MQQPKRFEVRQFFFLRCLLIPLGRHRAFFYQASEFNRGRIIAYRDGGLSLKEIDKRVGQNQATVLRIHHHWRKKETTGPISPTRPTACDDWWIVRMKGNARAATSRAITQQIQSVTHHSVSARTIRCRLQQSEIFARHPLLRLPLNGNHRRLRRQWCVER
ncbi:transposable element Tcb1 transposase [Trichonephila clavipes]|nr:transposable element Tcb1 transposase [Trichonephila clavipes]